MSIKNKMVQFALMSDGEVTLNLEEETAKVHCADVEIALRPFGLLSRAATAAAITEVLRLEQYDVTVTAFGEPNLGVLAVVKNSDSEYQATGTDALDAILSAAVAAFKPLSNYRYHALNMLVEAGLNPGVNVAFYARAVESLLN